MSTESVDVDTTHEYIYVDTKFGKQRKKNPNYINPNPLTSISPSAPYSGLSAIEKMEADRQRRSDNMLKSMTYNDDQGKGYGNSGGGRKSRKSRKGRKGRKIRKSRKSKKSRR